MKYGKKNRGVLIRLLLLGAFSGTIAWSLLERAVSYMGVQVQMGVGPVGFDLQVVSFFIFLNPGTLLGIAGSLWLFRSL